MAFSRGFGINSVAIQIHSWAILRNEIPHAGITRFPRRQIETQLTDLEHHDPRAIKLGESPESQPRRGVQNVALGAVQRNPGLKCPITMAASGNPRFFCAPSKPNLCHAVGGLRRSGMGGGVFSLPDQSLVAYVRGFRFTSHPGYVRCVPAGTQDAKVA